MDSGVLARFAAPPARSEPAAVGLIPWPPAALAGALKRPFGTPFKCPEWRTRLTIAGSRLQPHGGRAVRRLGDRRSRQPPLGSVDLGTERCGTARLVRLAQESAGAAPVYCAGTARADSSPSGCA
jgi:hypothetical protein